MPSHPHSRVLLLAIPEGVQDSKIDGLEAFTTRASRTADADHVLASGPSCECAMILPLCYIAAVSASASVPHISALGPPGCTCTTTSLVAGRSEDSSEALSLSSSPPASASPSSPASPSAFSPLEVPCCSGLLLLPASPSSLLSSRCTRSHVRSRTSAMLPAGVSRGGGNFTTRIRDCMTEFCGKAQVQCRRIGAPAPQKRSSVPPGATCCFSGSQVLIIPPAVCKSAAQRPDHCAGQADRQCPPRKRGRP